jgi:hypothetical protein
MGLVSNTPHRRTSGRLGFVIDPISTLARWLSQGQQDPSAHVLARVARARSFGELFWSMRDLGQALRQSAYTELNAAYGRTAVPDPRTAEFFSNTSVLREAARKAGLRVYLAPEQAVCEAEQLDLRRRAMSLAWLYVYSTTPTPDLCLRSTAHQQALIFQGACVIGWWLQARTHFSGGAPQGAVLLPDHTTDLYFSPTLHAFAKGLLNLDTNCPESLGCHCNRIIYFLNAAPEGHPQATGALSLSQLHPTAPPVPRPPASEPRTHTTKPIQQDTWEPEQ